MSGKWKNILSQLGYNYSDGWAYQRNNQVTPYQGFKLHISSTFEEAQKIINRMAPFLTELGYSHKCHANRRMMEERNRRQSKKLFTIYPTLESETEFYGSETIKLKRGDRNFNRGSVFANANNFEEIAETILEALKRANLDSKGPKIEDERRYKGSRLHFRYSAIKPERAIVKTQKGEELVFRSSWGDAEKRKQALEKIEINLTNNRLNSEFKDANEALEYFMERDQNSGRWLNTPIFGESGTIEGDSYHPPELAKKAGENYQ